MALIKKNDDFGFSADYWRVINISIDLISRTGMVFLGLYYDKDTKRHIDTRVISVYGEDFDKYFSKDNILNFSDLYEAGYICTKENLEYFKDAEDDEDELMKRNRK